MAVRYEPIGKSLELSGERRYGYPFVNDHANENCGLFEPLVDDGRPLLKLTAIVMRSVLSIAVLLPAVVLADDGDGTLLTFLAKSDVVLLGEFTSEPLGESTEGGVMHYLADFKISQLIKGEPRGQRRLGGTIKANIVRFEFEPEDRLPELTKGGKCILFLKCNDRQETPSYITSDIWFGVLRPSPSMAKSLARLATAERHRIDRSAMDSERWRKAVATANQHMAERGYYSLLRVILQDAQPDETIRVDASKLKDLTPKYDGGGGQIRSLKSGEFVFIEHINSTRRKNGKDPVVFNSASRGNRTIWVDVPERGRLGVLGDVVIESRSQE
jgi:hypothetical protein